MSTPVEYMKLLGKVEAMKAEHAAKCQRVRERAELGRDQAWRRRIHDLGALCEIEKRDPTLAELRALGSPEV